MTIRLNSWILSPLYLIVRILSRQPVGCENLPKDGAFIIACNHVGYFDQYIMITPIVKTISRHFYFLSKTGNYKIFEAIPIDKENPSRSLENLGEVLKKGEVVAIFPEGKANPKKELAKGKTGVARLALINKVPVVPVGLDGPHGSTVKESFKDFFKGVSRAQIKVGKPILFEKYYNQEITKELLEIVTGDIMNEISRLSGKQYPY
ncbi:1-acyl-sn-glycerol-3-phosphate acyltransferase [Patescibacteria group bacterium]|nr:1-acyl-sn-glycerol-3-phosphate acyltransferase [Patescibacteria group bacterium]